MIIISRPEVIPLLRLPLCEALATACCHPCTALREDSGVLSTGANQWEAPPHQSCCRNSRICQCAFARCAVAAGVVYSQVSTPNFRREIHRELASCSRRCKEIREFLNTE